jgi:hypothetical protein
MELIFIIWCMSDIVRRSISIDACRHDKCTVLSATFDKLGEILTWDIYGLRFSISHLRRWLYYIYIYIAQLKERFQNKSLITTILIEKFC